MWALPPGRHGGDSRLTFTEWEEDEGEGSCLVDSISQHRARVTARQPVFRPLRSQYRQTSNVIALQVPGRNLGSKPLRFWWDFRGSLHGEQHKPIPAAVFCLVRGAPTRTFGAVPTQMRHLIAGVKSERPLTLIVFMGLMRLYREKSFNRH